MSIARQIADMIDSGGDVESGFLDNVPASDWNTLLNVPDYANTDTRIGSNITSGTIPTARMGSGSAGSGSYLRGDGSWVTNCTNHSNCSNCSGTGTLSNCTGTLITASGSATGAYGGTLTYSGSNISMASGNCACNCACACNC
jgi:hypothetical protein